MHVWALGLWCETPTALLSPGLHTTTRELQTCTFDSPGASSTTKKPTRKRTLREEKSETGGGETEKRARNFGHPTLRGPITSGPNFQPKWIGQNWIGLVKSGWLKRDWPKSVSSCDHCLCSTTTLLGASDVEFAGLNRLLERIRHTSTKSLTCWLVSPCGRNGRLQPLDFGTGVRCGFFGHRL